MATDSLGITVPAGGDAFDPQGDMVALANSMRSRVIVPVANTTARTALVAAIAWTPSASEPLRVSRADAAAGRQDEITRDGGATWLVVAEATPWANYTPAIAGTGGSPSIGSGSIVGRYTSDGLTQRGYVDVNFGSGATSGSGQYYITLPLTTVASPNRVVGSALMYDSSAAIRNIAAVQIISATQVVLSGHGATSTEVGSGQPWVWASGDFIRLNFETEVA